MEDIIKRIQNGDKNAYTELYEKTKCMVMYNIRLKGVSPDDEEDVAQETYKKVFEKIDTLEKPEDACLWIKSIAANTAVDHMRKSGKIQTVPMDEITGPEEVPISEEILLPEDAVEREMALKELGDLMRALPADSYKLLAARYYNKQDYKTIEAELGISVATARKRVQRILGDMRETTSAKRKKGTTMLTATAAAPVLFMFFAEDAEAAVVPAGLSAKVAAMEAAEVWSTAAAGTGKTAISFLTGLITKKTAAIALIGVLALSGGIAITGCGEKAGTESTAVVTETPKPTTTPTKKATPTPTKKATPTPTKKPTATPKATATPALTKKETPKATATPTPAKKPTATSTPVPAKMETPVPTKIPTKMPTTAPAAHTHTWVANTKTVTDKAAYDEQVLVKEAWDEQVVVKEAWDEQVVVKEAWDEQVQVSEAWDEPVIEGFYTCNICGYQTQDGWDMTFHCLDVCGGGYHTEGVQTGTIHHDAGYETVHHDAEYTTVHHDAEYTTVHHDAEYQTVHHDAVTHTETTYTCSGCGATK